MSQNEAGTPKRILKELANEVARERDPLKLSALLTELNALLVTEERRRVLERFERRSNAPKSAA